MRFSRHEKLSNFRQVGLSYAEIARRSGLTRERVRQIITGINTAKKKPVRNYSNTLLTTAETAELLNVHVNTIRRWSNKGILKTYRIGPRGDRRFKQRDIDNFILGSNQKTGGRISISINNHGQQGVRRDYSKR